MNPCEITLSVTALANAIACRFSSLEEFAQVAAVLYSSVIILPQSPHSNLYAKNAGNPQNKVT